MKPCLSRLALMAACVIAIGGCASTGGGAPPPQQPAARLGLRPEYRFFYDALVDYGDWVLIEPPGFVFRPSVHFASWNPYEDGFWAPSDSYGWVWISAEPFGWATYHYGRWFYDSFQGWVWQPGIDWGPAWVAWEMSDHYVGWAPLGPFGQPVTAPNGGSVVAPLSQLGSTDLRLHLKRAPELGPEAAKLKPVDQWVDRGGIEINLGPEIEKVERTVGRPLPRVQVEDLLPATARPGVGRATEVGRSAPARGPDPMIEATRRAALEASRQAQALRERGSSMPARLPIVRPIGAPEQRAPRPIPRRLPVLRDTAAVDSTR